MGKIKSFVIKALKGIPIGVAMIVPGISGGTLAVMMGVYDEIINAVSNLRKETKKSIITLFPLGVGGLIGFLAFYPFLYLGLKYIPFPTICLFAGLIIGGFPDIAKKTQDKKQIKPLNVFLALVCFIFAASLGYGSVKASLNHDLSSITPWLLLFILVAGILSACALAVPGVSGSMLLLVFGLLTPIIHTIVPELLEFKNLWNNIVIVGTLGIGILIGFIIISKLMSYLLKRHETSTFYGICGFILGSLVSVFYNNEVIAFYDTLDNPWHIVLSVVLLIIGILSAYFVSKLDVLKTKQAAKDAEIAEINHKEM